MKKKTYQQPKIKVVELELTESICQESQIPSTQNETYQESSTEYTGFWYR